MIRLFFRKTIALLSLLMLLFSSACAVEIDAWMASMSVREKIGQLFWVRPDAVNAITTFDESAQRKLAEYPVGGFVIFSRNIRSAKQLQAMMDGLTGAIPIPPVFAVDEEGGAVARIAGSNAFSIENVGSMGSIASPEEAYAAGQTIGSYLKELGFHLDFAPVADVRTNPRNTVIGNRAFSNNPDTAAEYVAAAVRGFHDAGMACTLKHFPGHGHTDGDSHHGSASTDKTWEDMLACEIKPFQAGITAGAEAVMVGHILSPNASSDPRPASLSPEMIKDRLRAELGFDGLVITDSLAMGAVTQLYPAHIAAAAALNAGADVILMPADLEAAFDALVWAVEESILPMDRVDESVRRILIFKRQCGLI